MNVELRTKCASRQASFNIQHSTFNIFLEKGVMGNE
jgi:hypothetical protein